MGSGKVLKQMSLSELKKLVREGEHQKLEFKLELPAKAKLAREAIAFANADGGSILVGVSDNGSITGLKDPDEAVIIFSRMADRHCRPRLKYSVSTVEISRNRTVVAFHIPKSNRKPHMFSAQRKRYGGQTFFRIADRSILASREYAEIMINLRDNKDILFEYGLTEMQLIALLEDRREITLSEFIAFSGISKKYAREILVLMSSAGVLRIQPMEKEDKYSLQDPGF